MYLLARECLRSGVLVHDCFHLPASGAMLGSSSMRFALVHRRSHLSFWFGCLEAWFRSLGVPRLLPLTQWVLRCCAWGSCLPVKCVPGL